MKISLTWLDHYIKINTLSTEEIAEKLTFAGIEVEGVEQRGVRDGFIVIGQIKESEPHPDAQKLSVCQVDVGETELKQIVCGAKNYNVGDKVPVALPSAVLPGNFTIKETKLRGIFSQGMMCSGKELGLDDDHQGLLILSPEAPLGQALHEYLPADTILDLEITPNRPDLLSYYGIARELSALTAIPLEKNTTSFFKKIPAQKKAEARHIDHKDQQACPYYTTRIIKNVKVAPSPSWLKERLLSAGLRPINNIVDITNYVLLETGQPLHVFDLGEISLPLSIRPAENNESFTALDENKYSLLSSDLVIADQKQVLALAGVIGGLDSGVSETTTDVLLESAWFLPSAIRATSRRLKCITDSSYRFERKTNPHEIAAISQYATDLILELAGGQVEAHLSVSGSLPEAPLPVELEEKYCQKLLGAPIATEEIERILENFGLQKSKSDETKTTWKIPTSRPDLTRPADLCEEIARVYGLENIPSQKCAPFSPPSPADKRYSETMKLRRVLAGAGFQETNTLNFCSEDQLQESLQPLGKNIPFLALKNPLNDEHTHLRPSIAPKMLEVAAYNQRYHAPQHAYFEIGTTFGAARHPSAPAQEFTHLCLLLSGDRKPRSWENNTPQKNEIHHLLGSIQKLLPNHTIETEVEEGSPSLILSAALYAMPLGKTKRQRFGTIGQVAPQKARKININDPLFLAEIDLSSLIGMTQSAASFGPLPRYPSVVRDIALELTKEQAAGEILSFIKKLPELLLVNVELIDSFTDSTGKRLSAEKKSLTFSLFYQNSEKTLTAEEVDTAHQEVIKKIIEKFNVTIR